MARVKNKVFAGWVRRCLLTMSGVFFASGAALAQSADLVVNHSDSPDPGPAGGVFTYTLRVDNNGPNLATGVTLSDVLPVGSTFVSVNTTAGTCSHSAGTVNCSLGDIPFTSNQTVSIAVRLPTAGVWTNTATANSGVTDPTPGNNVNSTQPTTALQAADLSLTATPSVTNVVAGESYSYTLVANNGGPDTVFGRQEIWFSVPPGASVTAAPSGVGWLCAPATGYPLNAGGITCTRNLPLNNGESAAPLLVPATANVNGTVTAAFTVDGFRSDGTSMPDADLNNNTVTGSVTSVLSGSGADVSITKVANIAAVAQGGNVTYTLTPRLNGGLSLAAETITVTDTLDPGLTYVSATGAGWTCDASALPVITCTLPGYAGANFTDMPPITVTAQATGVGNLVNTAGVATSLVDPVPANNTASVGVLSGNGVDLRVGKSTPGSSYKYPDVEFEYNMSVNNAGPLTLPAGQTFTLTDQVPAGVTLLRLAAPASGWTCDPLPVTGPANWSCTNSSALLVGGYTATLRVVAVVPTGGQPPASVEGTYTNNACVVLGSGGANRVDTDATNDCQSRPVVVDVDSAADLRLSKTSSYAVAPPALPGSAAAVGQDVTYVITVENLGPAAAAPRVTDSLSRLMAVGGLQSVTPSSGTCSALEPSATQRYVQCQLALLQPGETATVTLVVRHDATAVPSYTNTAEVLSFTNSDPNPLNNTGSVITQFVHKADLMVAKTATPATVAAGAPITFVSSVSNAGTLAADAVQMNDVLPANAVFIALDAVSGGGVCVPVAPGTVGGTLQCSWPQIVPGVQQTVTYRMRPLASATGGVVTNTVAATTTTPEIRLDNNSATTTTPVTPAELDILVNKVDSVDPLNLGASTVYTITINNSGPSYGTNVVMTDVFPAPGATPSATFSYQGELTVSAGGTCTQPAMGATSGTLRCTFPGLASGESAVVTYKMTAEALLAAGANTGVAFNAVSVSVDEAETLTANNQVVHDTTTRRFAVLTDMAVVKTAPAGPVAPGSDVSYVVTVTNNGPLASDGAQVMDTLPDGLTFLSANDCILDNRRVVCSIGALAVGASRTFTINARLALPYLGARPLVNTATVDAPGDTNPSNNSSSASTVVSENPPPADGNVESIPTLSEWGLIFLALLLGWVTYLQAGPALRARRF